MLFEIIHVAELTRIISYSKSPLYRTMFIFCFQIPVMTWNAQTEGYCIRMNYSGGIVTVHRHILANTVKWVYQ